MFILHIQYIQFCRLIESIKNSKYLVGQRLVNYDPTRRNSVKVPEPVEANWNYFKKYFDRNKKKVFFKNYFFNFLFVKFIYTLSETYSDFKLGCPRQCKAFEIESILGKKIANFLKLPWEKLLQNHIKTWNPAFSFHY